MKKLCSKCKGEMKILSIATSNGETLLQPIKHWRCQKCGYREKILKI